MKLIFETDYLKYFKSIESCLLFDRIMYLACYNEKLNRKGKIIFKTSIDNLKEHNTFLDEQKISDILCEFIGMELLEEVTEANKKEYGTSITDNRLIFSVTKKAVELRNIINPYNKSVKCLFLINDFEELKEGE